MPEVPVAEQWTRTINNFSLIPIYPMRENVYVGDIRLTVNPAAVGRDIIPYRNLGFVDLGEDLEEYYASRPSLPIDVGFDGRREANAPWEQPAAAASIFVPAADPANTNRMRLAALPGVKVATVVQGSLGGRIPIGGVGQVGTGLAGQSARLLDISLAGIEEIEAPTDYAVFSAFRDYCEREKTRNFSPESLRVSLAQLVPPEQWEAGLEAVAPRIQVLSRVLYARAIDYTFRTDEGYGADLAVVLGPLQDLQGLSQALGSSAVGAPSAGPVEPTAAGTAPLATEVANLVASLRSKLSATSSPGVVFSTVFVDARGVTLRDVYARPLAFAAQATAFDADPSIFANICNAPAVPGGGSLLAPPDQDR